MVSKFCQGSIEAWDFFFFSLLHLPLVHRWLTNSGTKCSDWTFPVLLSSLVHIGWTVAAAAASHGESTVTEIISYQEEWPSEPWKMRPMEAQVDYLAKVGILDWKSKCRLNKGRYGISCNFLKQGLPCSFSFECHNPVS